MNLKDRLVNIKKNNNFLNNDGIFFDVNCDVNNFFIDRVEVKKMLSAFFSSFKNIIYVCDKNIDNALIANYFYSISNVYGATIVDDVVNEIENFNNRISIIPNPNIKDVVKIFEYILYGYKSFVFGLNFSSNLEIINKLKTVIAINYPNLTDVNINTLLGFSNSLFVYVSMNDDGLFYISEINEMVYSNEELKLKNIFSVKNNIDEQNLENAVVEEKQECLNIDVIQEEDVTTEADVVEQSLVEEYSENEIVEESDIEEETTEKDNVEIESDENQQENISEVSDYTGVGNIESENIQNKVNKYKLLKEKVKNKRNI